MARAHRGGGTAPAARAFRSATLNRSDATPLSRSMLPHKMFAGELQTSRHDKLLSTTALRVTPAATGLR